MTKQIMSAGLQAFCMAHKTDSPESAMRNACSLLLSEADLQKAPIPLRPLLTNLGITVKRVRGKKSQRKGQPEALLTTRQGRFVAYLYEEDSKREWRRARFTLAHEIGHALVLNSLGDPALISSLEGSPETHRQLERLCDFAASEILMPARAVRSALKDFDFTPRGLIRLYDYFLVSREALVRRVAAMTPHTSVVKWRPYARSEAETTQMRVVGSFPGYNRVSTRPWLPSGCTTRHLDPPIVDWAASRREVVAESDLRILLGGRTQECVGMATLFPLSRTEDQQPLFDGFKIADEGGRTQEIFLFVADKIMAGEVFAWNSTKG